jgi:hypothetical protein
MNPSSSPHEEADHHHQRPEENARSFLESAAHLSGGSHSFYFGPERKSQLPSARESELKQLSLDKEAPPPPQPSSHFLGGEHAVWTTDPPDIVFKHTVPGFYGRILDETVLLDPRTFQNKRKLAMRGALPSEYLRRWAVCSTVFGVITKYEGVVNPKAAEPQMAVSQPYIVQDHDDVPVTEDVIAFFEANGFKPVSDEIIVNPEIHGVTWYRQHDGILATDAHLETSAKTLQRASSSRSTSLSRSCQQAFRSCCRNR